MVIESTVTIIFYFVNYDVIYYVTGRRSIVMLIITLISLNMTQLLWTKRCGFMI